MKLPLIRSALALLGWLLLVLPTPSGAPAAERPRCSVRHAYLGDHPHEVETGWHDRTQGISHDADHWYVSQNLSSRGGFLGRREVLIPRLLRIPVSRDLSVPIHCRTPGISCYHFSTQAWGRERLREGYFHLGDIVAHAGFLFAPLQGWLDGEPLEARIAAFRADASLAPVAWAATGHPKAGWLAASPAHALYTSDWTAVSELRRYRVDLEALGRESRLELMALHPVPLLGSDGRPHPVERVQGGTFSGDGRLLYLLLGFTRDGNRGGIRVFELMDEATGGPCTDEPGARCAAWLVDRSRNAADAPFAYVYDSSAPYFNEPEGITWWDLDDVPGRHPSAIGQLHAVLLDRDESHEAVIAVDDDDVSIKHYRAQIHCDEEMSWILRKDSTFATSATDEERPAPPFSSR